MTRHGAVERILCGHIHRPIQVAWGGAIVSTAPSTSHAQVALALTEANGFNFEYAVEPRATQLYVWDPGYGWISHLSYISDVSETYRSPNAPRLREEFQRRYDDLRRTEFDAGGPTRGGLE